jgi:hypothetical protein
VVGKITAKRWQLFVIDAKDEVAHDRLSDFREAHFLTPTQFHASGDQDDGARGITVSVRGGGTHDRLADLPRLAWPLGLRSGHNELQDIRGHSRGHIRLDESRANGGASDTGVLRS